MAKGDKNTATNEITYDAVAKQFIKYGGEHLKAGDKFKVNKSDVEELSNYADMEIPKEDENNQNSNGEGGQQGGE
jgi:hypothetical protein